MLVMPSMGEKYICGGREFWCVGFNGRDKVIMRSGAVVMETPAATFDTTFRYVGSMEVGGACVAKETYAGVEAGKEYGIESIDKGIVTLSSGVTMDMKVFTAVF